MNTERSCGTDSTGDSPFVNMCQTKKHSSGFPQLTTFTLGRDPRTICQKEGYLNATLNATSLLRSLSTVSRVVHWQGHPGPCQ